MALGDIAPAAEHWEIPNQIHPDERGLAALTRPELVQTFGRTAARSATMRPARPAARITAVQGLGWKTCAAHPIPARGRNGSNDTVNVPEVT
jgi:hypothetical protein